MRPVSSFLDRFRRGVAVPAALADDLAAELAPVFASLELIEAEARAVRESAAEQAARRLAAGTEQAARISAGWRRRAEAERARAAEERRARAHEEARAIVAAGRSEADRIRRRAGSRMGELVATVIRCVESGSR